MLSQRIGFIGGGQMAEAIVTRIVKNQVTKESLICICESSLTRREYLVHKYPDAFITESLSDLLKDSSVFFLSVKPNAAESVLGDMRKMLDTWKDKLVISICAGITISQMEKASVSEACIIRVMPNMAALVGEAASAYCANIKCSKDDKQICESILNGCGRSIEVKESNIDAVTGISGSGPGYILLIAEAMIDAGVLNGLTREEAHTLTAQTLIGTGKLMLADDYLTASASNIRGKICSPGGTTITACAVLESRGVRGAIIEGINACCNKCKELSK